MGAASTSDAAPSRSTSTTRRRSSGGRSIRSSPGVPPETRGPRRAELFPVRRSLALLFLLRERLTMNRVSRGVAFLLAAAVLATNVRGQVCEDYSIGVVPLDDLRTGKYQGFAGGLYPDGRNFMPDGHAKAGRRIAEALVPLDANGDPAS